MVNSATYSTPGYQGLIHKKWENFINDIEDDYSMVRPEVLASWSRSRSAGVNPHKLIHTPLSPEALSVGLSRNAESDVHLPPVHGAYVQYRQRLRRLYSAFRPRR